MVIIIIIIIHNLYSTMESEDTEMLSVSRIGHQFSTYNSTQKPDLLLTQKWLFIIELWDPQHGVSYNGHQPYNSVSTIVLHSDCYYSIPLSLSLRL